MSQDEACGYCRGQGMKPKSVCIDSMWQWETCAACGGMGTHAAMLQILDENAAINRQLVKRYGTIKPDSIQDFWE